MQATYHTHLIHGSEDSLSNTAPAMTSAHDYASPAPYLPSNNVRYTAPVTVEAPALDLSIAGEALIQSSKTAREAGFKLVSLLRRHGFCSADAFFFSRQFLKLRWAKVQAARKAAKAFGKEPVRSAPRPSNGLCRIKASDWRGAARRELSNQRGFIGTYNYGAGRN